MEALTRWPIRILPRKVAICERFVHHHDSLTALDIAAADAAAAKYPHADGFEVVAGDSAPPEEWTRFAVLDPPLGLEPVAKARAGQGQTCRGRHGRDTRKRGNTIQDGMVDHDGGAPARILAVREPDAKRQRRGRVEAGIDGPHFLKTAEHQPRRDHQHEGQSHLASHQQVTRMKAAAAGRVAPSVLVQRRGQRRHAQQRNRAERDTGEHAQDRT